MFKGQFDKIAYYGLFVVIIFSSCSCNSQQAENVRPESKAVAVLFNQVLPVEDKLSEYLDWKFYSTGRVCSKARYHGDDDFTLMGEDSVYIEAEKTFIKTPRKFREVKGYDHTYQLPREVEQMSWKDFLKLPLGPSLFVVVKEPMITDFSYMVHIRIAQRADEVKMDFFLFFDRETYVFKGYEWGIGAIYESYEECDY